MIHNVGSECRAIAGLMRWLRDGTRDQNFTIQQSRGVEGVCVPLRLYELSVPPYPRLSTYSDRAFPVAAVRIWNSLPQHITSAPSFPVFCSRLKTHFFEIELC